MRIDNKLFYLLTEKVEKQMDDSGVNWDTIKDIDIKNSWSYPMACGTLFKVLRKPSYFSEKQTKRLLDYYHIEYETVREVIYLVEKK